MNWTWVLIGVLVVFILGAVVVVNLTDEQKKELFGNTNNNPMNIKSLPYPQKWKGQVGTLPNGLAVFDTFENGMRAGAINTLGQFRAPGVVYTLAEFGQKYAPAGVEGNESGYGVKLAKQLGVEADDPFIDAIPRRLGDLCKAIIQNEEGPAARKAAEPFMALAVSQARAHYDV